MLVVGVTGTVRWDLSVNLGSLSLGQDLDSLVWISVKIQGQQDVSAYRRHVSSMTT